MNASRNDGSGFKAMGKLDFTYNADRTVMIKKYFNTIDGQNYSEVPQPSGWFLDTFSNGNLIKEENFDNDGISTGEITIYEYDDKITQFVL